VDVVLFVVEAGRFNLADAKVLALLPPASRSAGGQQARRRAPPQRLLPWLRSMQERHAFAEFVPMSAKNADVQRLLAIVEKYLPEQPWCTRKTR
jgi:GTPase